jgi:NAD(P)H-hydrate epimerase
MSARAALRCGAGIVEVALPRSIYSIVAPQAPEAVFTLLDPLPEGGLSPACEESLGRALSKASACLVGCGLGTGAAAKEEVERLIGASRVPLVVDADGINLVARNIDVLKTARAPVVLTPHPGEMARLLGTSVSDVQAHRREFAARFAAEHRAVLVLKGAGTLVALPDGRLFRNPTGNAGMAKGGSGDVLAGMIASFAAQGIEPGLAAAGAVYLHGLAGDRCAERLSQTAMLPTDLIETLPSLFSEIGR